MLGAKEKLMEKLKKKHLEALCRGRSCFYSVFKVKKKMHFLYFMKTQSKIFNKKKIFLITRRFEN